jgi:soluble lytic murein transglycosylase-like protein
MRLLRGLLAVSLAGAGFAASDAAAAPLAALSDRDVTLYAAAFSAAERGDVSAAEASLAQVSDPCLAGKVEYLELTRGKARSATYEELSSWLNNFSDVPGADEVYRMAVRRKPAGVTPPAPSALAAAEAAGGFATRPAPESRAAREAYFDGDVRRALQLARASGDAWIAGLAAFRLGDFADAMVSFETLASNSAEADGVRAAGGFWAARSAVAAGAPERATPFLKLAAQAPDTFYGMVAARKLELADDPLGRLIETATKAAPVTAPAGETSIERLVRTDTRARRAVALAQVGRPIDAGAELRAGYAQAPDDGARALWMGLMYEVNSSPHTAPHTGEIVLASPGPRLSQAAYPTPALAPAGGFTIDKSLVYAIVWQESRFNSLAVSPVGAVGLMQLMPPSAANMAGDDTLKSDPITLFDTGKNLALGQAYITWLSENSAGHDILRTIAAYNGGPATLVRTETLLGPDADSFLVIESLPYAETRAYVRKVMAAYWTYRRQFGGATRTLDAAASDLPMIDIRLDGSSPTQNAQPLAAPARQPLEVLLARPSGG